jgi:hypothetical protein
MSKRLPMSWFQESGVTTDQVDCRKCPDPWEIHELELIDDETQQGGWIECPVEGCGCKVFWFASDVVKGPG